MKTLPVAALGAGLLLMSLAAPALADQASPAPQPQLTAKARGDEHGRNARHEQRAEKHEAQHDQGRDQDHGKEERHDRS